MSMGKRVSNEDDLSLISSSICDEDLKQERKRRREANNKCIELSSVRTFGFRRCKK